jgi:hypothetical protein
LLAWPVRDCRVNMPHQRAFESKSIPVIKLGGPVLSTRRFAGTSFSRYRRQPRLSRLPAIMYSPRYQFVAVPHTWYSVAQTTDRVKERVGNVAIWCRLNAVLRPAPKLKASTARARSPDGDQSGRVEAWTARVAFRCATAGNDDIFRSLEAPRAHLAERLN